MPENASAFVTLHTAICRTNNLKIVGLTYTPVMDTQRNQWWIMCERNALPQTYFETAGFEF